jgi:hypothetical protein
MTWHRNKEEVSGKLGKCGGSNAKKEEVALKEVKWRGKEKWRSLWKEVDRSTEVEGRQPGSPGKLERQDKLLERRRKICTKQVRERKGCQEREECEE